MEKILKAANNAQITLRPVIMPDDEAFLQQLFFSTIKNMAAMWGLPDDQKHGLMEMQYRAQKMQYDGQFPDRTHVIILLDGVPAGRLYKAYEEGTLIGVDLTILPEYRNLGIGTLMLESVKQEAQETGRTFSFHVMKTNTGAIRLYERLQLHYTGENEIQYAMEWKPEGTNE